MSEIDVYRHRCIGLVQCPSRFEVVRGRAHCIIPIYRLDKDTLDASSFHAKAGDILLGDGSGESAALRISIPEAFWFYTQPDWDRWKAIEEVVHAYWTMNDAFVFCDSYHERGWNPDVDVIEHWLVGHILAFLVREYSVTYRQLLGSHALEQDGSLCRLPTEDELRTLHGKEHR